jgi:hypothetical protein
VIVVLMLELLLEGVEQPKRFPTEREVELIAVMNPALGDHWDSTVEELVKLLVLLEVEDAGIACGHLVLQASLLLDSFH